MFLRCASQLNLLQHLLASKTANKIKERRQIVRLFLALGYVSAGTITYLHPLRANHEKSHRSRTILLLAGCSVNRQAEISSLDAPNGIVRLDYGQAVLQNAGLTNM